MTLLLHERMASYPGKDACSCSDCKQGRFSKEQYIKQIRALCGVPKQLNTSSSPKGKGQNYQQRREASRSFSSCYSSSTSSLQNVDDESITTYTSKGQEIKRTGKILSVDAVKNEYYIDEEQPTDLESFNLMVNGTSADPRILPAIVETIKYLRQSYRQTLLNMNPKPKSKALWNNSTDNESSDDWSDSTYNTRSSGSKAGSKVSFVDQRIANSNRHRYGRDRLERGAQQGAQPNDDYWSDSSGARSATGSKVSFDDQSISNGKRNGNLRGKFDKKAPEVAQSNDYYWSDSSITTGTSNSTGNSDGSRVARGQLDRRAQRVVQSKAYLERQAFGNYSLRAANEYGERNGSTRSIEGKGKVTKGVSAHIMTKQQSNGRMAKDGPKNGRDNERNDSGVIVDHDTIDKHVHDNPLALHAAARDGDLDMVIRFTLSGYDLNKQGKLGWPPVEFALQKSRFRCVIFLIEAGTNMTCYTKQKVEEYRKVLLKARKYLKMITTIL